MADYQGSVTGEMIDKAVTKVCGVISGRDTITVTGKPSFQYVKLSLPFDATDNTKIIATVNKEGTPNPIYNICLVLIRNIKTVYALITSGANGVFLGSEAGQTSPYLGEIPSGTYYIDWLVIDKGTE
nr:MAG TPA: hypothetical protein [Caudoviricetes sp.]